MIITNKMRDILEKEVENIENWLVTFKWENDSNALIHASKVATRIKEVAIDSIERDAFHKVHTDAIRNALLVDLTFDDEANKSIFQATCKAIRRMVESNDEYMNSYRRSVEG